MNAARGDKSLVGTVLDGRYRLLRVLAKGGMGAVYEAEQLGLGRHVAVKVMRERVSGDPGLLERFEREAQIVAALGHPNVAQVYDFHLGKDGPAWIAMELVPGVSLAHVLQTQGALAPERVVALLVPLLGALEAAHAAGIVHRDLKPANVMITTAEGHGEMPKLLDFGIAKLAEGAGFRKLTGAGEVIGTPTYMAPEQALGEPVDARTDVYAMGLLTFAMVTGSPAFRSGDFATVLKAVLAGLPTLPSAARPGVPKAFDTFVVRATMRSPDARFASAREMAAAARELVRTSSASARETPPFADAVLPKDVAPTRVERPVASMRARRGLVWAAVALLALLVVGAVTTGVLVQTGVIPLGATRGDAVAGPAPSLRTAKLSAFIANARARVEGGAQLVSVDGVCVDRLGHIAAQDVDCGWTLTFATAPGRAQSVEYSLAKPSGNVFVATSSPVVTPLPSAMPDSDAVMAAFVLTPGCETFAPGAKETELHFRDAASVEVVFGKDRTEWRAAYADGALGPVLHACSE